MAGHGTQGSGRRGRCQGRGTDRVQQGAGEGGQVSWVGEASEDSWPQLGELGTRQWNGKMISNGFSCLDSKTTDGPFWVATSLSSTHWTF